MHNVTPYKFLHTVDDTKYGYGVATTGQFVMAVAHEVPVKKKILWFDHISNKLETLSAMVLPTRVMGMISMISCACPNDDETMPSDEDIVDDFRSLTEMSFSNSLHNNEIAQDEFNDAMWSLKKSTIMDDLPVFTDLKKMGWTHMASARDYLMRHSYWVRSSRPNDSLSVTDVKYFCSKNEGLTIISVEVITLPFEFIEKLNKEIGELV